MNEYYVYIIANLHNTTLYIGVTNDIERRMYEHKNKLLAGFSAKYNLVKLVWYEEYSDITLAIEREKQLKKWKREWKETLINTDNKPWDDLSAPWFEGNELKL